MVAASPASREPRKSSFVMSCLLSISRRYVRPLKAVVHGCGNGRAGSGHSMVPGVFELPESARIGFRITSRSRQSATDRRTGIAHGFVESRCSDVAMWRFQDKALESGIGRAASWHRVAPVSHAGIFGCYERAGSAGQCSAPSCAEKIVVPGPTRSCLAYANVATRICRSLFVISVDPIFAGPYPARTSPVNKRHRRVRIRPDK